MGVISFIVVPMLNEVLGIAATCRSLGFAKELERGGTTLVLVDNGSADGTIEVAERIRTACGEDRVLLVREAERGYVPARAAGVEAVADHVDRLRIASDRAFVLQADADTIYEPGYVAAMVAAANASGEGLLFEGMSIPPQRDQDPCRAFRDLEAGVDEGMPMTSEELDVVVDDKVAGYFLSDYQAWGGHEREFRGSDGNDELLAETTRLFIRGRLRSGARRLRVEEALATTSSRRILEDPALAFATAGFPREASWRGRWRSRYDGPSTLEAFTVENGRALDFAAETRRRHLAAIFSHLPDLVAERAIAYSPGRLLCEAFERAGVG